MVSIESLLTRELDLQFIDARTIAMEARLSLGIEGYPSPDQYDVIRTRAIELFSSKSPTEQVALREKKRFFARHDSMDSSASDDSRSTNKSSSSSKMRSRHSGTFNLFLRDNNTR